jgi:3-oxoacyl-[acyl-carrier-protein] synthase III
MAGLTVSGASIKGIASAVPAGKQTVADLARLFGDQESEKIAKATGVRTRRIAKADQCCSDLCFAASEVLLNSLNWDRQSIDAVLFVSQSFDYPLPATSCILQARLGLSKSCAAFDVALGCSGYVYGLWIASGLILSGCKRILMLAGDIASRWPSPYDRSAIPLFGDAGSATVLEKHSDSVIHFELGTDGTGYQHLITKAGIASSRLPHSAETIVRREQADGVVRSDEDLFMNGPEIFAFTIREVPPLISAILARAQWQKSDVDRYYFHQANKFMLDYLAKRMGLPAEKVPIILESFGNTSSASIPLAVCHTSKDMLEKQKSKVVFAGFGVGLSWGAVALDLGPIVVPPVVEVP